MDRIKSSAHFVHAKMKQQREQLAESTTRLRQHITKRKINTPTTAFFNYTEANV